MATIAAPLSASTHTQHAAARPLFPQQVPMVDVVFADVAQPDQARIVGLNAQYFLKNGGHFVISIKASCIDSTAPPEVRGTGCVEGKERGEGLNCNP